jgi:hypothetical protein
VPVDIVDEATGSVETTREAGPYRLDLPAGEKVATAGTAFTRYLNGIWKVPAA